MIIPVEVKSGSRTQAKSLKSYCERYNPPLTIKLVGKAGGTDKKNLVVPLYYASKVKELHANDEPGKPDMKKA